MKRIDDVRIEGLDLSSWRIAANGAEPVVAETLRRFAGRFAAYSFRPEAMTPVWVANSLTLRIRHPQDRNTFLAS